MPIGVQNYSITQSRTDLEETRTSYTFTIISA